MPPVRAPSRRAHDAPGPVVVAVAAIVVVVGLLGSAAGCSSSASGGSVDDAARQAATAPGSTPGDGTAERAAEPGPLAEAVAVADDDALYATPDPVPDGPHGTLLRYQELTPSLAEGARTYRILYRSRSLADEPIVVSGTALVPTTPPPPDGRVTLTIAHGTTGIADECAPSKDPATSEIGRLTAAVDPAWLVVQTDYEGLGTAGRHPYLVGASEGRSVMDAAVAVGSLPDADQGTEVAIAGYSQGGHGALWAGQVAPEWTPQFDVVGTFAGAPATEIDVIVRSLPALPVNGFGYLIVAGYQAAYPEADPADLLTEEGLTKLDAVDRGCTRDVFRETAGDPATLFRAEGTGVPPWSTLAAGNNPGQVRTDTPVLIIHSDEDDVVPIGLSAILHDRMCATGQVVERRVLAGGGDHGTAAVPAYLDGVAWLEDRVAGEPATSDCP